MPEIHRVAILEDSQDSESWGLALGYAKLICERSNPKIQDIVLLVHTKQVFAGTVLAGFLGKSAAKTLGSGGPVSLPWGGSMRLATLQTMRTATRPTLVVAYFADEKLLEFIDGLRGVSAVIAVPDLEDGAKKWIDRWGVAVHGQKSSTRRTLIDDPVFEKGLEAITRGVNLAHGLMNSRDKGYADEVLRILRAKGHTADPEMVKSWSIKHGWQPSAATELAALARKIADLKAKPSLAKYYNPEGKYESWTANST